MATRFLPHGIAILATIGVLYVAVLRTTTATVTLSKKTIDLVIETQSGGTVQLEFIEKPASTRVTIQNLDSRQIYIQLPEQFTVTTVANASLDSITMPNAQNGFVRYTIEAEASITLAAAIPADSVLVHNKNATPLLVEFIRIQPDVNSITQESQLVYERAAYLW